MFELCTNCDTHLKQTYLNMAVQATTTSQCFFPLVKEYPTRVSPSSVYASLRSPKRHSNLKILFATRDCLFLSSRNFSQFSCGGSVKRIGLSGSRIRGKFKSDENSKERREECTEEDEEDAPLLMEDDERREWRRKIQEVIDRYPDVEEEMDFLERKKKMQKLLADYPLVVEEEDPDWPEDADGWGFNLGQFFDKITIKNVRKDDDEDYDSDKEVVWQDDNYIRPVKDITSAEWEDAVFKDISPLIVLVHNRYRRPKDNEKIREELEKAVHIIWNCRLPSPRCVAVDAVIELELVSALNVSTFPEIIFTKAGKILHREKVVRSADELSKMMAFFYYGAAKPTCLERIGDRQETVPPVPVSSKGC